MIHEIIHIGTYVEKPTPVKATTVSNLKLGSGPSRNLAWYNVMYNRSGGIAPWGNKKYGGYNFYDTGCVPTSLAIAFSGYGINARPDSIADILYSQGLFNTNYVGAGGNAVTYAARYYGLTTRGITSLDDLSEALLRGNVVVAAVGSGKFGIPGSTHMVVLNGYSNGSTYVIDPSYGNKSGNATVSSIWNNQSYDPIDREGGFTLHEIMTKVEEVVPTPEPETPIVPNDPQPPIEPEEPPVVPEEPSLPEENPDESTSTNSEDTDL